ncbi:hypothetical protein B0H14DRAFT_3484230 [Mycena olivaceomarginata]|nr:hypothetical protein B0H14DRAFT_3484230 [Mycena olivaceomarginata]
MPLPPISVLPVLTIPRIHQDMQNGPPPPPHWHAQSYAAAVSAPAQTPIGNAHLSAQGYRGHDGCGPDGPVNSDFSLRPVTTTTQSIPIDPALQRSTEQVPFIHPQHREDHEHRPRSKKPDVCAKPSQKPKKNNKGKGKARDASPSSESDADNACSNVETVPIIQYAAEAPQFPRNSH